MAKIDPLVEIHKVREAMLAEYHGDFRALANSFKKTAKRVGADRHASRKRRSTVQGKRGFARAPNKV